MVASPLTVGLPAEEMSPGRIGEQMNVGCGAAQLLGVGGALEDHVPSHLTLGCSLHSWLHLSAQSQEQRW